MANEFSVEVDTSQATVRLGRISEAARAALRTQTVSLMQQLRESVRAKLSGSVLNVRSGKLRNSIQAQMVENPTSVYGRVFSSGVPYAAIHEYGGNTSPHDIVPKNGSALAFMLGVQMVFAKIVHHPGSKIPQRSYMRSSLEEMRAEIIERLGGAVRGAAKAA